MVWTKVGSIRSHEPSVPRNRDAVLTSSRCVVLAGFMSAEDGASCDGLPVFCLGARWSRYAVPPLIDVGRAHNDHAFAAMTEDVSFMRARGTVALAECVVQIDRSRGVRKRRPSVVAGGTASKEAHVSTNYGGVISSAWKVSVANDK